MKSICDPQNVFLPFVLQQDSSTAPSLARSDLWEPISTAAATMQVIWVLKFGPIGLLKSCPIGEANVYVNMDLNMYTYNIYIY